MGMNIVTQFYSVLAVCFCLLNVKAGEPYSISEPWTYPMRPGVPGWDNVEDLYAALEIPERVYKSMTTAALAESCLKVPLRSDLYAFNTLEDGFARILDRNSALRELLSRPDVGTVLLQKYRIIDLRDVISSSKTKKYSFVD